MSDQQPVTQPSPIAPAETARHQPRQPLTICGVVAVVFGALGLVLSFIPIINNIAAIFGFVGVVLAIIAIVGTFRAKKRGKVLSIVAAVLSILAIVITLAIQSVASKAMDDAMKESKGVETSQSSSSKSTDATEGKSSDASAKGEQDMEGDIEGMHVKIVSAGKSINDYNGAPTLLVSYEWTNNTTKNNSFAVLAHPQVFQNGTALDTAIYVDQPEGYDANSYMAEVQPGATSTVTLGYVLQDDSPVTVDVSALLSMDQDTKVTHTFALQ